MNSYKKGEYTATVVAVLLFILSVVWMLNNNFGITAHAQNDAIKVPAKTTDKDKEAQSIAINFQANNGDLNAAHLTARKEVVPR